MVPYLWVVQPDEHFFSIEIMRIKFSTYSIYGRGTVENKINMKIIIIIIKKNRWMWGSPQGCKPLELGISQWSHMRDLMGPPSHP